MRQLNLRNLLAFVDGKEHPDWLAIWEKDSVDYIVAYQDAKGQHTLRAVGPHQQLKTLARAVADRKLGSLQGYTPTLASSIKALECQRTELEERIAAMEEREFKLRERWEAAPQSLAHGMSSSGDLSLREQEIERREKELADWEERLQKQQQTVENESQFVSETEEQLNQRFQEFVEREAIIEQKEEEIQQMALKMGIAQ